MIIDCAKCPVRGDGCHGCVVTLLFGEVPQETVAPRRSAAERKTDQLDDVDRAIAVLAAAGMLAPAKPGLALGAPWVAVA